MRLTLVVLLLGVAATARAEPPPVTLTITLQNHRFSPDALTVPAGQRLRLEVINRDPTGEEFDSDDLKVEREIGPHGKAVIPLGPLAAGTYSFMGELHAATASGKLTVTP